MEDFVRFCTAHRAHGPPNPTLVEWGTVRWPPRCIPAAPPSYEPPEPWVQDFFAPMSPAQVVDLANVSIALCDIATTLLKASNYLDTPELLEATVQQLAGMMSNKTVSGIRIMFGQQSPPIFVIRTQRH